MTDEFRPGTQVMPLDRIHQEQIRWLHRASISILDDPGILCFNHEATDLLDQAGCTASKDGREKKAWRVRFPEKVVMNALETVPRRVILGARNPENRLLLDSGMPVAYFGTGAETNIYLKTEMVEFERADKPGDRITHPVYREERGSIKNLCESAKLCNRLDNVDFFIRNVNIQDPDISADNKDVNVFLASLLYMTKHVQAGLSNIDCLDQVLKLAKIVAGGADRFRENPVISFIACLVKSPLQMVDDTTAKLMAIAKRGVPLVVSSSPQGGSTAPIREEGMVSMINAEILAGITVAQLTNPGTPVLYGAVPVRARLDNLHDLYGAPEFIHYNVDCIQMARHYGVPCYSTAGVGDAKVPGMQATVEKLYSYLAVAGAGAQYIHYALGLLDKTNVFCPLQAVLDDAHIGIVRQILRPATFDEAQTQAGVREVGKVMESKTRLFARHIRKAMRAGLVSETYPFESKDGSDEVMIRAYERLQEIIAGSGELLDDNVVEKIFDEVPGLVARARFDI